MAQWQSPKRSTVTPFVMVKDAKKTIEFAIDVFGAALVSKPLMRADGSLWNAEVKIGDSTIMFSEPQDDMQFPVFLYVHVPDADETFKRAVAVGAEPMLPPTDQFYGEHDGGFRDAQGNIWWVSTHKEIVEEKEIERRAREHEKRMKEQGE
ncbi:MAG: VOC family protein [Pseudomonadota bacterium]